MTTIQKVIFLSVAFVASLLFNALLYIDLSNEQGVNKELTQASESQKGVILQLESQLADTEQQRTQWQNSYRDLSAVVEELRNQLNRIIAQQNSVSNTASLSEQQLSLARQQISQLESNLNQSTQRRLQLEQELSDANATIANLQRFIRNHQNSGTQNTDNSELLTRISSALDTLSAAEQISLTETVQGDIRLSIPNEWLFNSGTVELTEASRQLASLLVNELNQVGYTGNIEVTGHSDERLIVSALAERYATNWELSTVRAGKVAHLLELSGWNSQRLTASGKADTQPVREESGTEAWQINRRIDIILPAQTASL